MLKFSANISMMFGEEEDPIKRMELAKNAGFGAIEYLFVYDMNLDEMAKEANRVGIEWSVINIAIGEGVKHGPLVAAAPGKEHAWRENVAAAIPYCTTLKPAALVIPAYAPPEGLSKVDALSTFKENLKYAADAFGDIGTRVIVEPLNPNIRPNSLLSTSAETMAIIEEVGHPNLGLEFDAYHMYYTEGNMEATVEQYLPYIGNIQIADGPERHEPGTGEMNYDIFLAALERLNYENWVACEYVPSSNTLDSLEWMGKWM